MSTLKSEGTIVQENEKTYWFKDDFKGEQVSPQQAVAVLEGILDRKLNAFESKLLMSRPFDGSTNITIIGMLVLDPSQATGILALRSIRTEVIGYIIRRREKSSRFNYGDVIGTEC